MEMNTLIENVISKIFKRNKVPIEIKILAVALFLQGLGVRRISSIVNKAKSSVHEWTVKFREALNCNPERKKRKCIAIDETKIKVNSTWYFIYAAIDIETRELIAMKACTARNYLNDFGFC